MKILLFAEKYPDLGSSYNNDFVHQRALEYQKKGNEIFVGVLHSIYKEYAIDGVNVISIENSQDIESLIKSVTPDIIGIHFYTDTYQIIIKKFNGPIVIWIHGHEALNWYRRLYDYTFKKIIIHLPGLLRLIQRRIILWREIVNKSRLNGNIHFIFVSNWMKQIAEVDNLVKFTNYSIIPNSINIERFKYLKKNKDQRLKILCIRPFTSKKYANDITTKTIIELSKRSFFQELEITIYGDGPDFEKYTNPLIAFSNVNCYKHFVLNQNIPLIHQDNGIFLCPTRQDAQGVSMCEAMSSGLVPITSNNTAIPEFVGHLSTGLLNKNSPKEFADSIEYLYHNPDIFLKLSANASKYIQEKCNPLEMANQELKLFTYSK